ncbi:Ammonia transport outward protein 2 [Smittium mucronatum]|uniref:Ammonia transport outward protein 2 n=1 Tax=Smittium mucronatum TaxID=133383 RepID=A0A1R0GYK1_9FUNG|nr:Ammonia transport outward protein 2 [Smittium mucronatum]OLY82118.1 Ammonia transport outward protein 2 [Smittium mucronatum]
MHNGGIGIARASPNNIIVGLAMFYGGFVQILAGMWEFANKSTFAATAFASYGAFWMSYAVILIPGFGVAAGWEAGNKGATSASSLGIYLLGWAIFTFIMMIASFRVTLMMTLLFALLEITYIMLSIGAWRSNDNFTVAGGILGFIVALIAFYIVATHLINKRTGFIDLYNIDFSKHDR